MYPSGQRQGYGGSISPGYNPVISAPPGRGGYSPAYPGQSPAYRATSPAPAYGGTSPGAYQRAGYGG